MSPDGPDLWYVAVPGTVLRMQYAAEGRDAKS